MSTNPNDQRDLRSRDLCFVDVETTGPIFGYHEIIDIGAVRTSPDGSEIKGTWGRRLRPKYPERITIRAREVNGFREEVWETSRYPSRDVWDEFVSFAQGCVPVAHNPSFDRAFITLSAADCNVLDLQLDYHWIGTETLAWPMYLSGELAEMSLGAICDYFGIPREADPHRAMEGASVCHKIYCALTTRIAATY